MYGLGNGLSKQYFFPRLLFRGNSWLGLKEVDFKRNSIEMFLNTSKTQVRGEKNMFHCTPLFLTPLISLRKGARKTFFYSGYFSYGIIGFQLSNIWQIYKTPLNDKATLFLPNHSEIMVSIEKSHKASDLIRLCQNINFVPRCSSFMYYMLNPSGK